MFHHIGKKIKAIANGMCWVGIVGICISVFIFVGGSVGLFTNREAVITIGSYCAGSGVLLLLLSFFAYGFGELVDNSRKIAERLEMERPMDAGRHPIHMPEPPMPASMPAQEPEREPEEKADIPAEAVEPAVRKGREGRVGRREARQAVSAPEKKNDTWQCPECGTIHPAIRPVCLECGEPRPDDGMA